MKKLLAVFACLCLLCGCTAKQNANNQSREDSEFMHGVWITYSTLNSAAAGDFKSNFTTMADTALQNGINTFFVHVRAFSDSIYPSEVYPKNDWSSKLDFDPLSFMIDTCHQRGIAFHAWINPYRIGKQQNADNLKAFNNSLNEEDFAISENSYYLNPASVSAQKTVIDGVREILKNYDVDGIHIDDYFYPTGDSSFDESSYNSYIQNVSNPLSLENFRRANVNALIGGISSAVKTAKENVIFSVSPAADIEKNYNNLYADVSFWCMSGYIDTVIPQLYFGFDYPNEKFSFERLLIDWIKLTENTGVKLCIGLAPYKLGLSEGPDAAEWQNGTAVVANELLHIYNQPTIEGAVFFSYSSLFSGEAKNKEQLKNITERIKEFKK